MPAEPERRLHWPMRLVGRSTADPALVDPVLVKAGDILIRATPLHQFILRDEFFQTLEGLIACAFFDRPQDGVGISCSIHVNDLAGRIQSRSLVCLESVSRIVGFREQSS